MSGGWTVTLRGALLVVAGPILHPNAAASLGAQARQSEPDTFTSPAGKFRVAFRLAAHRTFSADDWSPGEDFVILPNEGWASAPGTPERTVLSLSESLDRSTASIAMDTLKYPRGC